MHNVTAADTDEEYCSIFGGDLYHLLVMNSRSCDKSLGVILCKELYGTIIRSPGHLCIVIFEECLTSSPDLD